MIFSGDEYYSDDDLYGAPDRYDYDDHSEPVNEEEEAYFTALGNEMHEQWKGGAR
jgi:hypothetical protein